SFLPYRFAVPFTPPAGRAPPPLAGFCSDLNRHEFIAATSMKEAGIRQRGHGVRRYWPMERRKRPSRALTGY
ncbi:MAG: hypothetical protein ACE5FB_08885, partial [Candidatus Binatia bacterium]